MMISELMAEELPREMAMTRSLLATIPDDKLLWKPSETLHTIGWNADHIVEIIGWVPGILNANEWDIAPVGAEPYTPIVSTQVSEILDRFDNHSRAAIEALQGVPDSEMAEPWSLMMGGQTLFTMKKGDCIRKWVFCHSAHHRGILSVYLKMAGIEFTSIYEQ